MKRQIIQSRPVIVTLLTISVAALALTSCVKDPVEEGSTDSNKIQVLFTIPDQVPGSYATVGSFPSEREFDEVSVIFYDASGNYVSHVSSTKLSNSSVGSFEVMKPMPIEINKQYKLLILTNLKHYLDNTKYASTKEYLNDKKSLPYNMMRYDLLGMSTNRISRYLPMYAESDITITETPVVSVIFKRAVARFDFVSIESELDIEWVKVCNYNNMGYFYHNEYNAAGSLIINGAGTGDVETEPKMINLIRRRDMTDPLAAQSNTSGGLYAFPNINVNTGVNDTKTTCLLFKGTYRYTDELGNPKTKEGYYRVNVSAPGKPQKLKRNNIYRITIKSVLDGGSNSEDEAMKNPSLNVNYEINDWNVDGSQEVITDADENYLIVSPTSAYVGGAKGSSMTGSIKVSNGLSWTIEKLTADDNWFSVTKTTDNSGFIFTALDDNTTPSTRTSKVKVRVLGTTLQYDIFVYQYSKSTPEDVVLIVGGHMGNFSLNINGTGQTHKLQVILGANSANATMSYVSGDNTMIQVSNPAINTPGLGNNTMLNLVFGANTTGKERSSVYKITRKNINDADITINVTFTQPVATQIIVPSPNTIFTENSVDGFVNLTGSMFWNYCKFQRIYVSSLNTTAYPKWKATSTFNTFDVALVSKPSAPTTTYPSSPSNVATGSSDEYFDIAVARCGPGDESIAGTIIIESCNSAGTLAGGFKYTIPLTVHSSLNLGFSQIGPILWHDRNIGTPESEVGNESKITKKALPFSNSTRDYQSADKTGSYQNSSFKGTYYTFWVANGDNGPICPTGWRTPTPDEIITVASMMQWAKGGYRPYIVTNTGKDKDTKGCYFPLSGYALRPIDEIGVYWSNLGGGPNNYHYLQILPSSSILSSSYEHYNIEGATIRCVKNV